MAHRSTQRGGILHAGTPNDTFKYEATTAIYATMNVQVPGPSRGHGTAAVPLLDESQQRGETNGSASAPQLEPDDVQIVDNQAPPAPNLGATTLTDLSKEDDDNTRHIPGINKSVDLDFYNSLFSVDGNSLTEQERAYSDEHLESLTVAKLRELTPKMSYDFWEGKKKDRKVRREAVPISGPKGIVLGKVLAYYHFMREQRATDGSRLINNNPIFTPEEDARLIEIVTDPGIFPDIRFAFQSGSRADIDSVDGSLVETTWNAVIAGRYFNNFDGFQPPSRHPDPNDVLYLFDPNKNTICRRTGATLKNRFAQVRSKCTVLNNAWGQSGDNDPSLFEGFVKLHIPLDRAAYYMWLRIREGGELVSRRILRTVPVGNDSRTSTRDPDELMRIMQGRDGEPERCDASDGANNSNNGGAIARVAKKNESKKKRKQDASVEGFGMIAGTLEAIADPKGRREARRAQLIGTMDGLDQKMNTLLDELDPDRGALLRSRLFIKRRRRMYREARSRRWLCQRELEALEAGHDDVEQLPAQSEPETDSDEADFLHDEKDSEEEE